MGKCTRTDVCFDNALAFILIVHMYLYRGTEIREKNSRQRGEILASINTPAHNHGEQINNHQSIVKLKRDEYGKQKETRFKRVGNGAHCLECKI